MRAWQVILIAVGIIVALLMAFVWPALRPVMELGRWSRAYPTEAEARAALAQNPNDTMAHYTLSVHAKNQGDREKELEAVCQLDPTNQMAQYELGVLLYQNGRDKDALPWLKSLTNPRLKTEANALLQRRGKAPAKPASHSPTPLPR